MIKIGLSDFLDFISTSGTTRATKVRSLIERPEYHPALDYYKRVRDVTAENLAAGRSLNEIADAIFGAARKEQRENYAAIADGMRRLRTRKGCRNPLWFDPPAGEWTYRDLVVSVAPELGLVINNRRHAIKMYCKEHPLPNRIAWVVNHLMQQSFDADDTDDCSTLDARRGTLITGCGKSRDLDAILRGEADAFLGIHHRLKAA